MYQQENKSRLFQEQIGTAYVYGDNSHKGLGIQTEDIKTPYATAISKVQDKEGNEIELPKFEVIETSEHHTSLSDEKGFVYSTGLNENGELGTEDFEKRGIFTKIGKIESRIIPDTANIPINTSKDLVIELCNSYNLKKDIADGQISNVISTNKKEPIVSKIADVDNSEVIDITKATPNYKVTGKKIGRVLITCEDSEGINENAWINVVDSESAVASAKVVNGKDFTIALRSDGTVWGFGTINNQNIPEKIEVEEEIVDIVAGKAHALILGKSGAVYSIGANSYGQLGTRKCKSSKQTV